MSLRYREFPARPELRPFIECYWRLRGATPADAEPQRITPDACPELIVHQGDVFARAVGTRWVRQPRIFLAGTLSRPWLLRAGRQVDTVGIRFRPGAVTALFPISMAGKADREVPPGHFLGAGAAARLRSGIRTASGGTMATRLDDWFLPLIDRTRPRGHDVTRQAVALLLRSRGRRRIEHVAATLGLPRRRLERLFARDLGIRPKLFARIVRLNDAMTRLGPAAAGHGAREAAVTAALEAGYFDQSHMSRDFRAVAGRRPGGVPGGDRVLDGHFTRPERLLEWLAGE